MEKKRLVIGPGDPIAGIIQLTVIGVAGFLACVTFMPKDFLVMKLIPASLVYLVVFGHLALLGDSFPLAPPGGSWTPEKSRLTAGMGMLLIWITFTTMILAFMVSVFPRWPISPLYLWFGAIVFILTLLYGINWNGYPFKGRVHPWVMMVISFLLVTSIASLVWTLLTNMDGTPFADSPMNHHGPLNVEWLTGYLVWMAAWFFIFNPVFTTQGWPFTRLGHPGMAVAQTIVALVMAYLCWSGSLAMGISPSFSFGSVASSIIMWAIFYSWHLKFWGITRFTNGTRAVLATLIVFSLTAAWVYLSRILLAPAADILVTSRLAADINILTIYFNLCIFAPIALAHNSFALRWPLNLPEPPGNPQPDQSV